MSVIDFCTIMGLLIAVFIAGWQIGYALGYRLGRFDEHRKNNEHKNNRPTSKR
jgi:hypothetical protein